jgi:hypothetical protein
VRVALCQQRAERRVQLARGALERGAALGSSLQRSLQLQPPLVRLAVVLDEQLDDA